MITTGHMSEFCLCIDTSTVIDNSRHMHACTRWTGPSTQWLHCLCAHADWRSRNRHVLPALCFEWENEAAATSTTLCGKQVCVLLHCLLWQKQARTVLWGYTVSLWLIFCCQLTIWLTVHVTLGNSCDLVQMIRFLCRINLCRIFA